jgi:hypothetical protein
MLKYDEFSGQECEVYLQKCESFVKDGELGRWIIWELEAYY